MHTADLAWVVLLLPLLAAVGITLTSLRAPGRSAAISVSAVVIAFALSLVLLGKAHGEPQVSSAITWASLAGLDIPLVLRLDPLSLLMLLIVTGVGGLIHIYSIGYMRHDPGYPRFFASLSFFTFSMLGIVLADNFVMMFIFWELVGVSSYLLIGFWYEKPSAADAAKKAFITNRLGDFGFLLGILLLWGALGSVQFSELAKNLAANPQALGLYASIAGLLIFCGAMGKSAQFPLHVWLPDAMEGPTPVSALIHAATMVAAGVYMLCRVVFLLGAPAIWPASLGFLNGVTALDIVAWVGGITAILAALMAVQQNDIKRILAYSTLSQLGYMVMAVGVSPFAREASGWAVHTPTPAMYHLATHAFFKALLFLGAGSVIHALHHEQDIWKMGGLRRRMPTTYWTFLIGALALSGVPPFSGFFSKDEIIASAWATHHYGLFILAVFVAMLTAFYMFRLWFVAFEGNPRGASAEHAHESPAVMTWPLIALSIPSVLAGWWGLDKFISHQFPTHAEHAGSPLAIMASIAAAGFGFSFALALYRGAKTDPIASRMPGLARAMRNRFYFDELYDWFIRNSHERAARLAAWIDEWIIGGLAVRGLAGTADLAGRALRLLQTGNLQTYAFLFVVGVILVLVYTLR